MLTGTKEYLQLPDMSRLLSCARIPQKGLVPYFGRLRCQTNNCKQIWLRLFTLVGAPNCLPYSPRNQTMLKIKSNESLYCTMAHVQDCDIIKSKFKLQTQKHLYFKLFSLIKQNSNCTATYHPSRKPFKLDKQDMWDTGEVRRNS